MKIKHAVAIRFYPFVFGVYNNDITDYDFLKKEFDLLRTNVIKSLEEQNNKNFEVIIIYNGSLDLSKYDFLNKDNLSDKLDITFIGVNDISLSEYHNYISKFYNDYEWIIETRIDHDDFVFKYAVDDIQNKIKASEIDLMVYGYCNGYTYINGEIYDFFTDCHGIGVWSVFASLAYRTNIVKFLPTISIYNDHGKFKTTIIDKIKNNDNDINVSFIQNKDKKAFIWYRHDACWSTKGEKKYFSIDTLTGYAKRKLLNPDLSNKDKNKIKEDFGFNYTII